MGILISDTHGIERYCGFAAQLDWLAELGYGRRKSDKTMLLNLRHRPVWVRTGSTRRCGANSKRVRSR
ncbi:DUF2817 domain-containing protein [Bradyrhizobium yuanmingense]|uniref:DUF2817 domain-containing protein n=1 Tax=Bradyrhizobium yuanmingense TaxID=108015 RepID=UPI0012E390F7